MNMDQKIAQMFGTDQIAYQQQEKVAAFEQAVDQFQKVAHQLELPIQQMPEDQVGAWYQNFQAFRKSAYDANIDIDAYPFDKQAAAFADWYQRATGAGETSGEDEVYEKAASFLNNLAESTISTQNQIDAAVQFGKIAAHAYVNTLLKSAEGEAPVAEAPKAPEPEAPKAAPDDAPKGDKSRWQATKEWASNNYSKVKQHAKNYADWAAENPRRAAAAHAAAGAALAAGGYAGYKGYQGYQKWKDRKREESGGAGMDEKLSFDEVAKTAAYRMLEEGGLGGEETWARLSHAASQDLLEPISPQVKMAAAASPRDAVLVRAFELAGLAGYTLELELVRRANGSRRKRWWCSGRTEGGAASSPCPEGPHAHRQEHALHRNSHQHHLRRQPPFAWPLRPRTADSWSHGGPSSPASQPSQQPLCSWISLQQGRRTHEHPLRTSRGF